jgi:phage terminase small subunit
MPRATLTRKQARFVELYLAGGNAAEAYRQAYSNAAPSRSVAREGRRLLKHPKIVPFLTAAEAKARAAQVEAANRYASAMLPSSPAWLTRTSRISLAKLAKSGL